MGDPRPSRRPLIPALHEALAPLVALSAVAGVLLPSAAYALRPYVPVMLAGQVAGVAMTITGHDLVRQRVHTRLLVGSLCLQWVAMPMVGYLLLRLAHGDLAGQGVFITSVAPAEITSALVAAVAGADAACAAALMTLSVAASCLLSPLWLGLLGPHSNGVGRGSLVVELVLSIGLPMLLGVLARERFARIAAHPRRCLDLAGVALLLVVFVGAGGARPLLFSARIGEATLLAVVLVLAGLGLGLLAIRCWHRQPAAGLAVAFPIGMREFGVATALALAVAPRAAGFGGLYGVLLMLAATLVAGVGKRRRWSGAPATI